MLTAEVTVKVLNLGSIALVCASPPLVYEGSEDYRVGLLGRQGLQAMTRSIRTCGRLGGVRRIRRCSALWTFPPRCSTYRRKWTRTRTYEYLLTASADNAEDAAAEVTVTVLNKEALAVVCADPGSVYEGSEDITFDCSASGDPGDDPQYTYAWTARGDTPDTALLSAVDVSSPMFYVPEEVDEDETYEYLLTASADNAEDC